MKTSFYSSLRGATWLAVAVLGSALGGAALAAPQPMDSSELAEVVGGDGVSIIADLNINASQVSHSFNVDGVTTYAVMENAGGGMFIGGVTVDVRNKPDASGESYIDIGLPGFVAFKKFGFTASSVQTDLQAPITASQNLGSVQINGNGAMTGHFLMWAK